ncbi:MAG: hypothetical protein E5X64_31090 [Mesorhizobium sp.]|uniref:hypothetical protein n=1 Tax=Mesorhizobium sp. TaxID=1871066 RepID=UPI000A90FC37|nr:hypothetical protein [Mesorhizobium sp.]RWL15152.1 MAG: hypothetical protein EOR57_30825 [Mesorhizobium sp.]RWM72823.1 MAG: hypothetical protein EOR82_11750 [Mesorhizobium sp.]TIO22995.1 MAG: hypothetical protein E5X83_23210 [Mesorhizobium sp.]TIQ92432.1 MAG: hypothetical protein E5X64_31090 [Mesorhizobium sp.]TJV55433.1 MAG: hypothetical protein E5X82_27275 [Mesorhizobium sp.]
MPAELVVFLVVEAFDGGVLDGPWMLGLGRAVLDVVPGAGQFEGMAQKRSPFAIASLISGTADPPAPGVVN